MVRAGAQTPSKKKEKEAAALTTEDKAEEAESKRLRELAFSRRLLSRSRSHAHHPAVPSKTILCSDGKDIVKKGHRKSKYLFAFPGLLSPIAGGKLGELTNLDSKNPILYVEFPQGRVKLFGTITYPKNKYLTLHFPRGSGNIICEDCFESIIVFSQAWWIGTKEQNPEEVRIPLPKSFAQERNDEVDFTAGAGQGKDFFKDRGQLEKSEAIAIRQTFYTAKPEISEAESTGKDSDVQVVAQSVRQSSRTAGRTLKYADSPSDSENSSYDESQEILKTSAKKQVRASDECYDKGDTGDHSVPNGSAIIEIDDNTPKKGTPNSAKAIEKGVSDLKTVVMAGQASVKAANGKPLVVKQSLIKSFWQLDSASQDGSTPAANADTTRDSKTEVTVAAMEVDIKSGKRSRKIFEKDTEGSDSDVGDKELYVLKGTPKSRKLGTSEPGAGTKKVSTPKRKIGLASKLQGPGKSVNGEREKQKKTTKEKAPVEPASITKSRKAVSKTRKSYKESSDTEDEDKDSDETNDDSDDEDYNG